MLIGDLANHFMGKVDTAHPVPPPRVTSFLQNVLLSGSTFIAGMHWPPKRSVMWQRSKLLIMIVAAEMLKLCSEKSRGNPKALVWMNDDSFPALWPKFAGICLQTSCRGSSFCTPACLPLLCLCIPSWFPIFQIR